MRMAAADGCGLGEEFRSGCFVAGSKVGISEGHLRGNKLGARGIVDFRAKLESAL